MRGHGRGTGYAGVPPVGNAVARRARPPDEEVGLGVDTQNASGALRLYEAGGMGLHFSVDTWEVTLPV